MYEKFTFPFLLLIIFSVPAVLFAQQENGVYWKIKKDHWDDADEKRYEEFIISIGNALEKRQCRSVLSCLGSSAINPYRNSDPKDMRYQSDCADFPYYLRAYFAWKNSLPFSFAASMRPNSGKSNKRGLRYSVEGNVVAKRLGVTSKQGSYPNALKVLHSINGNVSSAMFRLPPQLDSDSNDSEHFPDFYPVRITRESIRPGTSIYDADGHVAIVHRVEPNGNIQIFDAHPKSSISWKLFETKQFERSRPNHGVGFKNWRPLKLIGATKIGDSYIGGRIVSESNRDLPDYSVEQYYGNSPDSLNNWKQAKYIWRANILSSFQEYLRYALAIGDLKFNPVDELRSKLNSLCSELQDRAYAVEIALANGIHKKPHPQRLPENIYGTNGEWEDYSTPSRDARIKVSFQAIYDDIAGFLEGYYVAKDPKIVYSGENLISDLLEVYEKANQECKISYTKSNGVSKNLTLREITKKLFKLSFDPYHCPELRWGELDQELASCLDNQDKRKWYEAEQGLRNQLERTYDAKMDFTADELLHTSKNNLNILGAGVSSVPNVEVEAFLKKSWY